MARWLRLTSTTDFERVRREGKSHAHPLVILIAARRAPEASEALPTRVGVTAGKRVGHAVARNRAKRLLRETIRARYAQLQPQWDLVFVARAPLAKVKLSEAQSAVDNLLRRARVLSADE